MLGLNLVFWHHAIDRIGAGFATVLANTHVVFVLAGVLAAGGAVARRSLLALPLPLAGVVLIGGFGSGSQLDGLGIALALVAAAAYAAFQLLFDRSIRLSGAIAWPLFVATAGGAPRRSRPPSSAARISCRRPRVRPGWCCSRSARRRSDGS